MDGSKKRVVFGVWYAFKVRLGLFIRGVYRVDRFDFFDLSRLLYVE